MTTLQEFIRICASCKRVNDVDGCWKTPSRPAAPFPDSQVSHGICPACTSRLYPDLYHRLTKRHPDLFPKRA